MYYTETAFPLVTFEKKTKYKAAEIVIYTLTDVSRS